MTARRRAASRPGGGRSKMKRLQRTALCLWLVLQVTIAWAPFIPETPRWVDNDAQRTGPGLRFGGEPARALATFPEPWSTQADLAIALRVRTSVPSQTGPARVLSIARDQHAANLMIGQSGDDLVVRVRDEASDAVGEPAVVIPGVFGTGRWRRIDVVLGTETRVLVDHLPVATRAGRALVTWAPGYLISLGDEVTGARPWAGAIAHATVTSGGRTVDLLAPGVLAVPSQYLLLPDRWRESSSPDVGTAAGHVASWLVGGGLRAALAPVAPARVAAEAASLAVGLQAGKLFVEDRHASLADAGLQMASALVGVWACSTVRRRRSATELRGTPHLMGGLR